MATGSGNLPATHADPQWVRRGPLCYTSQYSAGEIHELDTIPRSDRNRCSTADLDQLDGVCFSPILTDWQVSQESKKGQGIAGTDSAGVEVVPSTAGTTDRLSPDSTHRPNTSDNSPNPLIVTG